MPDHITRCPESSMSIGLGLALPPILVVWSCMDHSKQAQRFIGQRPSTPPRSVFLTTRNDVFS